jgi:prepilin-type N-terminal cleavage/methylation domain-containing protein
MHYRFNKRCLAASSLPTRHAPRATRHGFTLIELLVVIFLLALLAGLTFLIVPNLNDQARAPRGAVMLQQWLLVAKNNALRDRTPWGIRLTVTQVPDPVTPSAMLTVAKDAQYIQQPGDFIVQPGVAKDAGGVNLLLPFRRIYTTTNTQTVALEPAAATAADFSGGFTDRALWPVQAGDYLEVNGGLPHRITKVTNATTLVLDSPLPVAITLANPALNYRILRSPRVVGEDQLQLPSEIVIDLDTNTKYGNPLPWNTITDPVTNTTTSTLDILFSPSGAVIGRGTSGDAIYLWVRDSTLPLFQGDNTLVAVQVRTGAAFAFPVDNTPAGDPYSIPKTGRAPQS